MSEHILITSKGNWCIDCKQDEPSCNCPSSFAAPTLLEGWSVQRRSYGVGTHCGGSGDVLCYGKWGVIGGTGSYKILHPTGWIEERPKFKTELEAMLWVMAKTKPKPSNAPGERPGQEARELKP